MREDFEKEQRGYIGEKKEQKGGEEDHCSNHFQSAISTAYLHCRRHKNRLEPLSTTAPPPTETEEEMKKQ
jgi:hypothetical protein